MKWLLPLPVVLPLLVAAGLVAAAPICRRRIADSTAILTAVAVLATGCLLVHFSASGTIVYWFGDWGPRGTAAIGISFVIDPIGAGMAAFCSCLMTAALVYSWQYFDAVRTYFHALMLIFLSAMNGFCLTGDLFNMFVFFELMSVVAYALTAYKVEETQALAGAINFAVTNSIGAFLVLIGIGLLYGHTGALNLAQIGEALAQHPSGRLAIVALTVILCGFFVKAAIVPFHFWLGDAHAVAPTPVCILFSGVMIELGLYGSSRVYWTVFHPALGGEEGRVRMVLMTLGALTAVLGAIMCFAQWHLKRLLAFSSISHVGMMLVGGACLTAKGVAGAALYILGHGFVKGSLFLCTGVLLHRLGSVDQRELFGRGRRFVVLGCVFGISGLGLARFPPYGTYLGKQIMEEAGASVGQHWLTWLFVFCSALTGGAVLRAAAVIFLGWGAFGGGNSPSAPSKEVRETREGHRTIPFVMLGTAVLLALAPLLSAVFGGELATGIHAASQRFIDESSYARAVMSGQASGPLGATEFLHVSGRGLVFGFVAAGGAAGLALVASFWGRLPQTLRRGFKSVIQPLIGSLQRVHSGHVGDLIVWLVTGVVVIGAGFATMSLAR